MPEMSGAGSKADAATIRWDGDVLFTGTCAGRAGAAEEITLVVMFVDYFSRPAGETRVSASCAQPAPLRTWPSPACPARTSLSCLTSHPSGSPNC